MDKRTAITAGAGATAAVLVAMLWPTGQAPSTIKVRSPQARRVVASQPTASRPSRDTIAAPKIVSPAIDGAAISGTTLSRKPGSLRDDVQQKADVAVETRHVEKATRPPVPPPAFYVGLGEFDATAPARKLLPYLDRTERPILYFAAPDENWREAFAGALPLAVESVCILDYLPGEFNGPVIEAMVRETHCREVVFAWHMANATGYGHGAWPERVAADLASAIEFAKRGNPDVFVWVCAVYGYSGSEAWAGAIRDLPFDGVALWGPHTLPRAWEPPFLAEPLAWAQNAFGGRPVAYASLYVVYRAYALEEGALAEQVRGRVAEDVPLAIEVCRRLGYAAVWRQVGSIPDGVFKGLEVER